MLFRELLADELNKQREDFRRFSSTQSSDLADYAAKLVSLETNSHREIQEKLGHIENCGAIPSSEFDRARGFYTDFWDRAK